MKEKYETAIAQYFIDLFPARRFPELAAQALEDGFDGPAIVEIAGMKEPSYFDLRDILPEFLKELGLRPFPKKEAGFFLARDIARKIVTGEMDPEVSAKAIEDIWVKLECPIELNNFVLAGDYISAVPEVREKMRERIIFEAEGFLEGRPPKKLDITEYVNLKRID